MLKFRLVLIFCLILGLNSFSQELKCEVQVLSQQIQTSDKDVFNNLKQAIYEFMNDRKWTNHVFQENERIDCSILINLKSWDMSSNFTGSILIQSSRPVYGTAYNTTMLNYEDDDFSFSWVDGQPLEFSESSHMSNLTSILAFYAYYIIGLDYDSMSEFGGSEFFQKAHTIMSNASGDSNAKGWKAFDGTQNRYWLITNMLDPVYRSFRQFTYKYHRIGLDKMGKELEASRKSILDAFSLLQKVHREKPSSFLLQVFFSTKVNEIVNMFSEALQPEKTEIIAILKKVSPANTNKWEKILSK